MKKKDLIDFRNNEKFIDVLIKKYKKKVKEYEGLKPYCTNEAIDMLTKKHNELIDILYERQKRQNQIIDLIMQIENTDWRNTIYMYFVEGYSLKDISIEINKDYVYVRQWNSLGIKEFEKISKNIK